MRWDEKEIYWYEQALEFNYYPENFIDFFQPLLPAEKKVLDIGCGIGAFARAMAKRGIKVTALDKSREALNHLKKVKLEKKFADQINLQEGDWQNFAGKYSADTWPAIFSSYSGPQVMGQKASLEKMNLLASDIILLLLPSEKRKHSFGSDELFNRLERPLRQHDCSYQDTAEILHGWGIDYQSKHFCYQFGQPFTDFNEAVQFFSNHYHIETKEEKNVLKEFLRERLTSRGRNLWIDNHKKSTLLYWQPQMPQRQGSGTVTAGSNFYCR